MLAASFASEVRLWQALVMSPVRAIFAVLLGLSLACGIAARASAQAVTEAVTEAGAVDLHLVLAVDVSWSMDPDEQRLQRDGYVDALRDAAVIKAIQSGPAGRIAVTYFEWAGADIQFMVVPWTIIDGAAAAHRLADTLAERRISRHRMTSISSALEYAHRLLKDAPGSAARRVVDVSGDGPNNGGTSPVTLARDVLLADGVIINGLPIMLKSGNEGGFGTGFGQDIADLDDYYSNCVIGGPGSFTIPIRKSEEFATATRQKLLQEISWLPAPLPAPRVMKAQFAPVLPAPRQGAYDCLVGERNWRRYYLDGAR